MAGTFAAEHGGQISAELAGSVEAGMLADMILNAQTPEQLAEISDSKDFKMASAAGDFDRGMDDSFVSRLANTAIGTPEHTQGFGRG